MTNILKIKFYFNNTIRFYWITIIKKKVFQQTYSGHTGDFFGENEIGFFLDDIVRKYNYIIILYYINYICI